MSANDLLFLKISLVTCDFSELLLDFFFAFQFGYIAYKQARFGLANVYLKFISF